MKFLCIIFSFFLLGCGQSSPFSSKKIIHKQSVELEVAPYKYEGIKGLDDDGKRCTTNSFESESKEKICIALVDEELNENCAREQRLEIYESQCL